MNNEYLAVTDPTNEGKPQLLLKRFAQWRVRIGSVVCNATVCWSPAKLEVEATLNAGSIHKRLI